ncbi:MAG: GNAT family N-acetyltransferase [Firmicutes bacterium]|nr:GNAT family N-acetyltransferase [Bacillota bacterium]
MNVELGDWKIEYADDLQKFANNRKIWRNLTDGFPHPYTKSDAVEFINTAMSADKSKSIFKTITVDGKFCGSIGAFKKDGLFSKSAEIGYWIAQEYWKKGIVTTSVSKICKIAFETFDIVRISATPFEHNTGSRRVLEKNGFILEGTMRKGAYKAGKVLNYCMYALLKEELT